VRLDSMKRSATNRRVPNIRLQATAGLRRFSQAASARFPAAPEPKR
jgi:hypothetical protein